MRFAAAYFYGRGAVKNMRGGLLKFDVLFRTGAFPSIWMWVEVGWGLNLNCIYGLCTFHSAMDLYHYVKVDLICGVLIRLRNKSLPKYALFSSTCSSDTANRKKKKKRTSLGGSVVLCPVLSAPVSGTAKWEPKEGDPDVTTSHARQRPAPRGEEQLAHAAQGGDASLQSRNAAGQTLPREVLVCCFFFSPPLGKTSVDVRLDL